LIVYVNVRFYRLFIFCYGCKTCAIVTGYIKGLDHSCPQSSQVRKTSDEVNEQTVITMFVYSRTYVWTACSSLTLAAVTSEMVQTFASGSQLLNYSRCTHTVNLRFTFSGVGDVTGALSATKRCDVEWVW